MGLTNQNCKNLRNYICKRPVQFNQVTRRWDAKIAPEVILYGEYTLKEQNEHKILELNGSYGLLQQKSRNKNEQFALIFAIENNQKQTEMVFHKYRSGNWSFSSGTSVCPLDQHIIDCVKDFP